MIDKNGNDCYLFEYTDQKYVEKLIDGIKNGYKARFICIPKEQVISELADWLERCMPASIRNELDIQRSPRELAELLHQVN